MSVQKQIQHIVTIAAATAGLIGIVWVAGPGEMLTSATSGLPSAPAGKVWDLKWADEFSGTSVDTAKWNVINNSNYGAANQEDQCYRAANTTVSGGSLRLTAMKQTVTCSGINPDTNNSTYYWTSGMVTTRAQGGPLKFKFRHGYIEARIKAPKGNAYWPAFWLVGPNDGSTPGWPDYGEFDIVEVFGPRPDAAFGTMHYACPGRTSCKTAANVYNLKTGSSFGGTSNFGAWMNDQATFDSYTGGTTDYNRYGFLWEPNKITWYVNGKSVRHFDGVEVRRHNPDGSTTLENTICTTALPCPSIPFSTVFDYEHSIILNLAVGGNGVTYPTLGYTGHGTPSGYVDGNLVADIPGTAEIDYVRLYQLADAPPPPPPPSPPPPPPGGGGGSTQPSSPPSAPGGSSGQGGSPTVTSPTRDVVVNAQADEDISRGALVTLDPATITDPETLERIQKVEFFVGDWLIQSVTEQPFALDSSLLEPGTYTIVQRTHYKDGSVDEVSRTITITATPTAHTADERAPITRQVIIGAALLLVMAMAGSAFLARHRLARLLLRYRHKPTTGAVDTTGSVQGEGSTPQEAAGGSPQIIHPDNLPTPQDDGAQKEDITQS